MNEKMLPRSENASARAPHTQTDVQCENIVPPDGRRGHNKTYGPDLQIVLRFIVRSTYDSDVQRVKISPRNIVS